MIEVISSTACIACDVCVRVCPTDVFDRGTDGIPVIARQSDCQTCFMCEAYCPVDALYVAPASTPADPDSPHADPDAVSSAGLLGSYRALIGWGRGRSSGARRDQNAILKSFPPNPQPGLPTPAAVVDSLWNHDG